ncbi:MAG: 16S rRNA (uracil(1498)-N(3))-methyltransferase [Nitrospinae bacterium]|nr:16S rRNA (uracil(1498)-N(3))-methyltransferase [Nitrospinota bacterium]
MRIWPVAGTLGVGAQFAITGADAKHIHDVLRYRPGDRLKVCDDDCKSFWAEITAITRGEVSLIAREELPEEKKRLPEVVLAMSLNKAAVLEIAVQKAVELGCTWFLPVVTRYSMGVDISPAKLERLRKIAHEAGKQCGRSSLMPVAEPVQLDEMPEADLRIVLWEEEKSRPLKEALAAAKNPKSVLVLIGPQSGFAEDEVAFLKELGFISAGLGPLILRAETAAIAAAAVVAYHFGKLD